MAKFCIFFYLENYKQVAMLLDIKYYYTQEKLQQMASMTLWTCFSTPSKVLLNADLPHLSLRRVNDAASM